MENRYKIKIKDLEKKNHNLLMENIELKLIKS